MILVPPMLTLDGKLLIDQLIMIGNAATIDKYVAPIIVILNMGKMIDAIEEGLNERKLNKENNVEEPEEVIEENVVDTEEEENKDERKPRAARRPRKPVSKK